MSQQGPPLPGGNTFGFGNFDMGSLPDASGGQMNNMGQNNQDDMMSMLDATMTNSIGDTSMDMNGMQGISGEQTLNPFGPITPSDNAIASASGGNNNDALIDRNFASNPYGGNDNDAAIEESIARAENQFNTISNNVPGAGPLPPSSFSQMSLANSNTLTEFTKRRNWPAKVVEELKDLLLILDSNGRVKYASTSAAAITGYNTDEIEDMFLKDLIHPDDQGVFVAELNEAIASGNTLRMFYRFRKREGDYTILETVGHAHIAGAKFAPNPNNQSPFCQAVFMMSRVYPNKNAGLLDSFLEHKIENERLKRRIGELRREEEEADAADATKRVTSSQGSRSVVTGSDFAGVSTGTPFHSTTGGERTPSHSGKPPVNVALTKENLEGVSAGDRPDSLLDKMERYEGTSHTDTIEMLTGLRYIEGERSRGITTGNRSPVLIKGDAGIAIPMDRDSKPSDKKKKLKTSEEYVCTDCGTLDSPEWRKGPSGPKTLCNACGLRWAKKEKKRNNSIANNDGDGISGRQAPMPDQAVA